MRAAVSLLASRAVGKHLPRRFDLAAALQMVVERDQVGLPPPPPPALAVARLVDDDAVDPGTQGGLAAEAGERPEDAQEDLLGHIECFVAVAQEMEGEVEDGPLMRRDEIGTGRLITGHASLDERGLAAIDL